MSYGSSENLPSNLGEGQSGVEVNVEPSPTAIASAASEFLDVATATSIAVNGDSSPNNTSPISPISKALSSIISSVIRDFDTQAEATIRSQDHLSFAIDRLTRELDQLLEVAPSPFIMQHAAKISGVRKRVSSLNSVLKSIQRRIDKIDRLMSADLPSGTYSSS